MDESELQQDLTTKKIIKSDSGPVAISSDFDLFWRRTLVKKKLMDEGWSTDEAEAECLKRVPA